MQFFDELAQFGRYTDSSVSNLRQCIYNFSGTSSTSASSSLSMGAPRFLSSEAKAIYSDQISFLAEELKELLDSQTNGVGDGATVKSKNDSVLSYYKTIVEKNEEILKKIEGTLQTDHLVALPYDNTKSISSSLSSFLPSSPLTSSCSIFSSPTTPVPTSSLLFSPIKDHSLLPSDSSAYTIHPIDSHTSLTTMTTTKEEMETAERVPRLAGIKNKFSTDFVHDSLPPTPKRPAKPAVIKTPSLEDFGISSATLAMLDGSHDASLDASSQSANIIASSKLQPFTQNELDALPSFLLKQINCQDLNIAVGKVSALLNAKLPTEQYLLQEEFDKEFGKLGQVVRLCFEKSNRLQNKHLHGVSTFYFNL